MKKVICIDGSRWREDSGFEPLLEDGEIYTIEQEVLGMTKQSKLVPCYKLLEIDRPHVYNIRRFILVEEDGHEKDEEVEIPPMEKAFSPKFRY